MKKTRIVATIGPSSQDKKTVSSLIDKGVNCARINTAHGDFSFYEDVVETVRDVSNIPIMVDIKGPELRVRAEDIITFEDQDERDFFFDGKKPHFSYDFFGEVEEGDNIYFDNGLFHGVIEEKIRGEEKKIRVRFLCDGEVKPNKGVNIPGRRLDMPQLSEKDKEAIEWCKNHDIEYIALSFVRDEDDVKNLRKRLDGEDIDIISKIESRAGVENLDPILKHSQGVMVARGDLGVEMSEEKIPLIQKDMLKKTNEVGKISIVATEMLESMIDNPVPTRAEVSDVANAVLDGADGVMLSGETAIGEYPIESVEVMKRACMELEDELVRSLQDRYNGSVSEEMSKCAYHLARREDTNKVVTITRSGYSAKLMSRFRLDKEVIAITTNEKTYRKLQLVWGINPVLIDEKPEIALITNLAIKLLEKDVIQKDHYVVFFAGVKTFEEEISNLVEIHNIEDLMAYHESVN